MNAVYRQLRTALAGYRKNPNQLLSIGSITKQMEWAYAQSHITDVQRDELIEQIIELQEAKRMGAHG